MEFFAEMFKNVLEMSLTGTIIAIVLFIVRFFMKKFPKRYSYILWGILAVRLLCPFSVSSVVSFFNLFSFEPPIVHYATSYAEVEKAQSMIDVVPPSVPKIDVPAQPIALPENYAAPLTVTASPLETALNIASIVWIIGLVGMIIYSVISYFSVRKRVSAAVLVSDNIYTCSEIEMPFVYGIIKPRIYIPETIMENDRPYIIAHEYVHIKRFDHIIKLVALAALSLHWFNPFVWISFKLMVKDMEMSCDERALGTFDTDVRKDYAAALLKISMMHNKLAYGGLLSFGESNIKSRIKGVLNSRKPALWATIIGAAVIIVAGVCLLTNASESSSDNSDVPDSEINEQTEKNPLTIDKLKAIYAAKGTNIDWSDFDEFEGEDVGSGVYLMCYPIDDEYSLYVSGRSLDEKPDSVILKRKYQGKDFADYDVLLGDLDGFLAIVPTPTGTTEKTPEQLPTEKFFLYNDVEIREEESGSGVPHTYGELTDYFTDNMGFIEYEVLDLVNNQEAVNITKSDVFLDTSSLYIAHAIYDHLNNKPLDFYFYLCKVGVPYSQFEHIPPCDYGDVYVSAFSDYFYAKKYNPIYNELNFAVKYDENGNKYAYHICFEEFEFVDKNGENLDIGVPAEEEFTYTNTSNNPVHYTKKIPFEKLTSFIREDFAERGIGAIPLEEAVSEEYDIEKLLSELDPRVREAVESFVYSEAENEYFWRDYEVDSINMDIPVITAGAIKKFNYDIVHNERNPELVLEDGQLVYMMCSYSYWYDGEKVTTAPVTDEVMPLPEIAVETDITTLPPETSSIDEDVLPEEEEEFKRTGFFTYNEYKYNFGSAYMDVAIIDEDGIIIEPTDINNNLVQFLYCYNDYEYLGNGTEIGYGNKKTDVYLVHDGFLLAISPYPNAEEELRRTDWLDKYPKDMIYAYTFIWGSMTNPPPETEYESDDANPGMIATRFVVVNGEREAPFPDWCYFAEIDGKYYILNGSEVIHTPSYRITEDKLYETPYLADILNNYTPTAKAVYDEKLDDDFDTNIEIMDGADVYYFENSYFIEPDAPLLMLTVTAEPQYVIDGVEVYRMCFFSGQQTL